MGRGMKLAIICPVGPLDRYGYQHNHTIVLENLSRFATRVYLCSTTRNRIHIGDLLSRFSNVQYLANEHTWFDLDSNGDEVFRIGRLEEAINACLERCKQDGMDCAVQIHINQYVQDPNRDHLRRVCQDMLDRASPFEWLYKKYQIADRLFHTDTRVPWILNLQIDNPYVIRADSIHHRNGQERYAIQSNDFRFMDHVAIVDCGMEMTPQDLADKRNFVRGYEELAPGIRWGGFNWDNDLAYYVRKFNSKTMSSEPLDATGQALAAHSQSDFVSWTILHYYRGPTMRRRLASLLRWHIAARLPRG